MKKIWLFVGLATLMVACSARGSLKLPVESVNNMRLNSPIVLLKGSNYFLTQDYILDIASIDSITTDAKSGITVVLSANKDTAYIQATEIPQLVAFSIWSGGAPYGVLGKKTDKIDYKFTYDATGEKASRYQIAGQMNDWFPAGHPDLVKNADGLYEVTLTLSPGTYLYQMVIDGDWNHDKNNPDKVDNNYGKFNSILHIKGTQEQAPSLLTQSFDNNNVIIAVHNPADQVYVFWQNYLLPNNLFVKNDGNQLMINLPKEATQLERSFLRIYTANEFGISNDLLIPLQNGKVLSNTNDITRFDKHAEAIYFLLIDRFKDGNEANNFPMNRPDVHPKVDYQGGDLAGITQKIKDGYFQRLGFTTIWLSPIVQNPLEPWGFWPNPPTKFSGYHGYWPISSSKIDFRFGTDEEMHELVKTAHEHNINIIVDYVANHVHKNHPLYQRDSTIATPLYLPDGRINTELWNEHRLTTWFDDFMPTIDFSRQENIDMMVDSALFWIKKFNLDGFRHDACKHVNEEFWRTLTHRMKKEVEIPRGKLTYQIGESYGSPQLIKSYVNTGMLDGQFDFNVFDDAASVFAFNNEDFVRVSNGLKTSLKTYGHHNLMGYISGNHDRARFISYASGDVKPGENSKLAGWTREIGLTDSTAYDKLIQLNAFNLTIPGVPVLYYGDEIGDPGANDPDCRRFMRFGDQLIPAEQRVLNTVAQLGQLRKNNLALIYGNFIELHIEKDAWAYARNYFNEVAIVVFNRQTTPKTIEIDLPTILQNKQYIANFGQSFNVNNNRLSITIPANGFEVLTLKK